MIAHYDLFHDKVTRTTSALLLLWDGQQLIDATAGFKDNKALAAPADSQANAVVAFGPGGTTLAVGYNNGDVYLWHIKN
jgi:hypothetical protein